MQVAKNRDWIGLIAFYGFVWVGFLFLNTCSSDLPRFVDPKIKEQVNTCLDAFDGTNFNSLDLDRMVQIGTDAIEILREKIESPQESTRWAAVMALAAIGHQLGERDQVLPYIQKAMEDASISVRVTAAEVITSFGDKRGILVLIDALDSDQVLRPSEPTTPIATQVLSILKVYIGKDFQMESKWRAWWENNRDKIKWDSESETFK